MKTDTKDSTLFSASDENTGRRSRPDELSNLDDYYREDGRYTLFPPPAQEHVLCMTVDTILLELPDEAVFLTPSLASEAIPSVPVAPTPPIRQTKSSQPAAKDGSSYSYRRRRVQRAVVSDPWSSEAEKTKAREAVQHEEGTSRLMQLSHTRRKPASLVDASANTSANHAEPVAFTPPLGQAPVKPPASPPAPSSYHKRRMQRALDPWRSDEYPLLSESPMDSQATQGAKSQPEILPFVSSDGRAKKEPPLIRSVQQPKPVSMPISTFGQTAQSGQYAVRKRSEDLLQKVLKPNFAATADETLLLPFDLDFESKDSATAQKPFAYDTSAMSERETGAILFHPAHTNNPLAWEALNQLDHLDSRDDTRNAMEQSFLLSLDDISDDPGNLPDHGDFAGLDTLADMDEPFDFSFLEGQAAAPQERMPAASAFARQPAPLAPPVTPVPSGRAGPNVNAVPSQKPRPPASPPGSPQARQSVSPPAQAAGNPRQTVADPLIANASALPELRPRTVGHSTTNTPARPRGSLFEDAEALDTHDRPHAAVENRRATLTAAARSSQTPTRAKRHFNMVNTEAEAAAKAFRDRWKGVSLVDDDPIAEAPAATKGWGSRILSFLSDILSEQKASPRKNLLAFSYGGLKNTDFMPKLAPGAVSSTPSPSLSTPSAPSLFDESPAFASWDGDDDDDDTPLWTAPKATPTAAVQSDNNDDEYSEAFLLEELAQIQNKVTDSDADSKSKKNGLLGWLSHLFKGEENASASSPPSSGKRE